MVVATKDRDTEGRRYAGVNKAERAEKRREAFLAAGLEVFGREGYRAGTVRRLCRAAGYTDRYFYESFASTEALLMAVYSRSTNAMYEQVRQSVERAVQDRDIDAVIRIGLDAFFHCVEDPRVARVCMLEVLGVSPAVDALYNQTNARFADMMLALVGTERAVLNMSSLEARVVAQSLVGALIQAASTWHLNDYDVSRKTMVSACYRIFVGNILP
jgi:AcrR family transcriptional regulator